MSSPDRKLVLIVDDTPTNVAVVSGVLKDSFRTKVATNGEKALTIANSGEKPHLILLDVTMPGMDGYEVAQTLRNISSLNSIPIIAVTSYAMTGDREKSLAAGCSGYIEKPINPETFVSEIEQFLIPPPAT